MLVIIIIMVMEVMEVMMMMAVMASVKMMVIGTVTSYLLMQYYII